MLNVNRRLDIVTFNPFLYLDRNNLLFALLRIMVIFDNLRCIIILMIKLTPKHEEWYSNKVLLHQCLIQCADRKHKSNFFLTFS